MAKAEPEILKLFSVALTREKQTILEGEIERYANATNWVIKEILKRKLFKHEMIVETLKEPFGTRFDKRKQYLDDIVMTARVEIGQHRKLAKTIISMRDKTPFFKPGRMILSQPLIAMEEKTLLLMLPDRTRLPIPFDKRSRNRSIEEIRMMVRGAKEGEINERFGRVRLTYNKEGYVDIDIRAKLPRRDKN
jgi:hypothetical protein